MDLHQRHETMDFGLLGHEAGENPAEAERVLTELGAHPVVAGSGRVSLVEDEIDDLKDRRESRGEFGTARHFERNVRVCESSLRSHNALRNRRLGYEESARDFIGRQATEQP